MFFFVLATMSKSKIENSSAQKHIVELKDISIFQEDVCVLSEVTVNISKGEFSYLIGKTGSGKSSLLKTLYGALPLKSGYAYVCDYDLTTLKRTNIPLLRRRLGIIFQDFNLLEDRTVQENLVFVLRATGWKKKPEMQTRIDEVLQSVEMMHAHNRMPHQLSGGEQQRVVIARALLNHPDLIIADEPTGNLDPQTSDDILQLLRALSKENNTAIILATHDYRILQHFPARIIRCQNGKVLDEENYLV